MRTFVIINNHNSANIQENIIGKLDPESNIIVFKPDNNDSDDEAMNFPNVKIHQFPSDIMEHDTKLKNFVSKTLIDCKIGGFVHVIEDDVKIIGDTNAFLVEIEKMMTALNLKSWFNTSCDIVNYVYQKYNPRFYITIDEKQFMLKYDKTIAWCSNANTVWICYDMDKIVYDDIRFEEKFTVPVHYIIEFLARRRNSKKPGELYYMNIYPSVPEELKVFTLDSSVTKQSYNEEYVKKENEIFNTMNINYVADNDINIIMEDIMKVLS